MNRFARLSLAGMASAASNLLCLVNFLADPASSSAAVVPKWGRFEHEFKSSVAYSNPLQQATLKVAFVSPSGQTNLVFGFWDGGKTWQVRFAPDQVGRWSYTSSCSDASNQGLHNQSGQFVCGAPSGKRRFEVHGPLRVASDHRHFEHADGTPFFWLADSVLDGARMAKLGDWDYYAQVRAAQKFNVAVWTVYPGSDWKGQSAVTTIRPISLDPAFFQRLDVKVDSLRRAGLLSAIALPVAWPMGGVGQLDEQTILLLRYIVARWGSDPVAWLLAPNGGQAPDRQNWGRIGRTLFGQEAHAPVILGQPMAGDRWQRELRAERWVDAIDCPTVRDASDQMLKQAQGGELASEWSQEPARPLIAIGLWENVPDDLTQKRFSSDEVRHWAYWSLMLGIVAGFNYGAQGVADWDTSLDSKAAPVGLSPGGATSANSRAAISADPAPRYGRILATKGGLPLWQRALFMPAAKQMATLAKMVESIEFWRLRPQPNFVANQPGALSPHRQVLAAATDAKDLALVYVPEDRQIEVSLDALPAAPTITWFNPRTGEDTPAVAVVGNTFQIPTPDPGDWVLIIKSAK